MKYTDKDLLRLRVTGCSDDEDSFEGEETAVREALAEDFEDDYEDECLALGTWVGEAHQVFDVIIHYRDPHVGLAATSRSWSLEVSARNRQDAIQTATKDFRLVESLSSGAWQREILAIEVTEEEESALTEVPYSLGLS